MKGKLKEQKQRMEMVEMENEELRKQIAENNLNVEKILFRMQEDMKSIKIAWENKCNEMSEGYQEQIRTLKNKNKENFENWNRQIREE